MMNAGEPVTLTKVDDLTVTFEFAAPYGLFLLQLASGNNQPPIAPRHYGEQFLPKYNEAGLPELMEAAGVSSWIDLFYQKVGGPTGSDFAKWLNPELPVLNGWTVTRSRKSRRRRSGPARGRERARRAAARPAGGPRARRAWRRARRSWPGRPRLAVAAGTKHLAADAIKAGCDRLAAGTLND